MAIFHYARVSTDEQTVENQQLAAKTAGYAVDHFYADEGVSGSTFAENRVQFSEMIKKMKSGDVLVISELSRIGRNTLDTLKSIERFEKMGVRVCVLNYGNLDLTSEMGKFIITVAAGLSAMELADIKRRTKAGLARTKAQGTKLGRPLAIHPTLLATLCKEKAKGVSLDDLSEEYGIPRNSISRNIRKWGDDMLSYKKEYDARMKQYGKAA